MYVMCLMSMKDSFDDRRSQCPFDLMVVLPHMLLCLSVLYALSKMQQLVGAGFFRIHH